MGELTAIEARIRAIAEERSLVAASRFAPGRSAADMRNSEFYLLRLEKTKESLLEAAAKAELAVEAARAAFVDASRDRKVLDKLKEKRLGEYKKATSIEELKVVDDISGGSAARRFVNDGGVRSFRSNKPHFKEYMMSDVLTSLLDTAGKIKRWPKKVEEKAEVLNYLAGKFEKGKEYTEKEVNAVIAEFHAFNDITMLRRELISAKLMNRTPDCRKYWVAE